MCVLLLLFRFIPSLLRLSLVLFRETSTCQQLAAWLLLTEPAGGERREASETHGTRANAGTATGIKPWLAASLLSSFLPRSLSLSCSSLMLMELCAVPWSLPVSVVVAAFTSTRSIPPQLSPSRVSLGFGVWLHRAYHQQTQPGREAPCLRWRGHVSGGQQHTILVVGQASAQRRHDHRPCRCE